MSKSYVLLGVVAVVAFLLGYLVGVQKPTPSVTTPPTTVAQTTTAAPTATATPAPTATPTKKIVIVDSAGKYVEITKPVTKIATLNVNTLEALAMLNATEYVAGASNTALDPKRYWYYILRHLNLTNKVVNVGSASKPNYEALTQLRPQILFHYASVFQIPDLEEKVAPLGIKVVYIDLYKPLTIIQEVKLLGLIFDREREAENYAKWVDKVMSIVNERLKGLKEEEKLTVYPEGYGTWSAHGPGSGLFQSVVMAGLRPITAEFTAAYPTISAEWVIQRNPDVVVKQLSDVNITLTAFETAYKDVYSRLSTTKAAKNNKIVLLTPEFSIRLGYPVGVLYVAKVAYPDRFRDVDPNQHLCEFLQMMHLPCKGVWGYAGPNNPVLGWP